MKKKKVKFFPLQIRSNRLGTLQNDIIAFPSAFKLGQNKIRISKQILDPPTSAISRSHPRKLRAPSLVKGQLLR